jgi:hypothetical protein
VGAVSPSGTLRRTPLFDRHQAAGAKLVPFANWEMPVQYPEGVRAEHLAVFTYRLAADHYTEQDVGVDQQCRQRAGPAPRALARLAAWRA